MRLRRAECVPIARMRRAHFYIVVPLYLFDFNLLYYPFSKLRFSHGFFCCCLCSTLNYYLKKKLFFKKENNFFLFFSWQMCVQREREYAHLSSELRHTQSGVLRAFFFSSSFCHGNKLRNARCVARARGLAIIFAKLMNAIMIARLNVVKS